MLKLYADKSWLPAGANHVVMLYPFWGQNPEDPHDVSHGRFDRYTDTGKHFFQMAPLAEADLAVLPCSWETIIDQPEAMRRAEQFIAQARQAGKRTVIFFWSDSDVAIDLDAVIVFRTSFYRSKRKPNEFAMPAWSEDLVTRYLEGQLPIRAKSAKPTIGFCGYAPAPPIYAQLKRALGLAVLPKVDASIRQAALQTLAHNSWLNTNFVVREHFFGHLSLKSTNGFNALQRARDEYVRNLVNSDYVLCARGAGNFSYRLYETLNCGRIPVFVDTDCVLPYDSIIPWKESMVWVDETQVNQIAVKIAEFHNALSASEFVSLQRRCQMLWEQYLSPEGFFENFHRHLEI